MGFTTGFTGGVTLTLSLAYLTVVTHQANRQRQCDIVRANTNVLRALAQSDPLSVARLAAGHADSNIIAPLSTPTDLSAAAAAQELYYPSKAEPPRKPRASFTEDLKTRWNTEVEGAVRRVQTTDWVAVREDAEGVVAGLWGKAFGGAEGTPEAATAAVKERVQTVTSAVKAEAKSIQSGVAAAASEAAAAAKSAAERAVGKGKELAAEAGKAKSAVAGATGKSEVEQALQQRYAHTDDGRMKKSVQELLDERYKQKA